jgi:general stress protein 26
MNSINQQQAEDNYQDLRGTEAVDKLKELSDKAKNCFFCTNIKSGAPFATRPMAIQQIDDNGTCWFLSATDSHTNTHIAKDPAVQLLLKGSEFSDFLTLYGHATVSRDKKKIHELWNPIFKTWFTEGEDDPRISVIQVKPVDAYYWDTKHGQIVGLAKQLIGAVTGKTLDDSIEGKLRL